MAEGLKISKVCEELLVDVVEIIESIMKKAAKLDGLRV